MCLAVPARVVDRADDLATVDMQGNKLDISCVFTPEARPGDWVLVHAGFAISTLDEAEAMETWGYLKACYGETFAGPAGNAGMSGDSAS